MKTFFYSKLEVAVLQKLKEARCADNTIAIYRREFTQLRNLAVKLQGSEEYTSEITGAFKADASHIIPENSDCYYGYKANGPTVKTNEQEMYREQLLT
ncbi:MAG: hypothetical protein IJ708_06095 [Clostridia bacterium]|nr:hypothetical protein [Clostridia bacterium]